MVGPSACLVGFHSSPLLADPICTPTLIGQTSLLNPSLLLATPTGPNPHFIGRPIASIGNLSGRPAQCFTSTSQQPYFHCQGPASLFYKILAMPPRPQPLPLLAKASLPLPGPGQPLRQDSDCYWPISRSTPLICQTMPDRVRACQQGHGPCRPNLDRVSGNPS